MVYCTIVCQADIKKYYNQINETISPLKFTELDGSNFDKKKE